MMGMNVDKKSWGWHYAIKLHGIFNLDCKCVESHAPGVFTQTLLVVKLRTSVLYESVPFIHRPDYHQYHAYYRQSLISPVE